MPGTEGRRRDIACARCRRRKKKCDHAKPICGECKRTGSECLVFGSRKDGEMVTIPAAYLEHLEARVAELEKEASAARPWVPGVQGEPDKGEPDQGEPEAQIEDVGEAVSSSPQLSLARNRGMDAGNWVDFNSLVTETMNSSYSEVSNGQDAVLAPRLGMESSLGFPPNIPQHLLGIGLYPVSHLGNSASPFDMGFKSIPQPIGSAFDDSTGETSPELKVLYANIYFANAQVQWPFLDEKKWKIWHNNYHSDDYASSYEGFFLGIVYAIGALLYGAIQGNPVHSACSTAFYNAAMVHYPQAIRQPSMLLRTQATLLVILYALHCPFTKDISDLMSSALLYCTSAMADIKKMASISSEEDAENGSDTMIAEHTFMACHILHEIVELGWDRPVSASYKSLDDKMYDISSQLPTVPSINSAFGHLFRLRKIQASMRRHFQRRENSADIDQFAHGQWSDTIKSSLDLWRKEIPLYGNRSAPFGYLQPSWMKKLYDYSVVILMQEKRWFLSPDDVQLILKAVTEVCLSFRKYQEARQAMCYTWSALVYQFRAGIMLLYAYWITPPALRSDRHSAQQTHAAVFACAKTLSNFANRWEDAAVFKDTFKYLMRTVPWNPMNQDQWDEEDTLVKLRACVEKLKRQRSHKATVAMISDMVYGPSHREDLMLDLCSDLSFDLEDDSRFTVL